MADTWKERRRRQAKKFRGYEAEFGRPSYTTATKVWRWLKARGVEKRDVHPTMPTFLSSEERTSRMRAAEVAFLVGLDAFLHRGAGTHRITFTMLADALARKFSDHYLRPSLVAPSISYMRVETVRFIRRDLLLAGVSSRLIWKTLIRCGKKRGFPLYRISWNKTSKELAYYVSPCMTTRLHKAYIRAVSQDSGFSRQKPRRLLLRFGKGQALATKKRPRHAVTKATLIGYDVCAERPYNVVTLTSRSEKVLRMQEQVRLIFDIDAFKQDYLVTRRMVSVYRRRILKKYEIKPDLSDVPRPRTVINRKTRRKNTKTIWSTRAAEVYYRSIELALKRIPASIEPDEREKTKPATKGWRSLTGGRIKGLTAWLKAQGRSLPRRILPKTRKDKIAVDRQAADWRSQVRAELNAYDKHRLFLSTFGHIHEQVSEMSGHKRISCRFSKMMNRRFKPLDFWPTYVSSKGPEEESLALANLIPAALLPDPDLEPYRVRWFKVRNPLTKKVSNLAGKDISSSQMQILAFLMGDSKLEEVTTNPARSFKQWLADQLWKWNQKARDPLLSTTLAVEGYKQHAENNEPDPRLQELVKELIMRVSYGSDPKTVELAQREDPGRFGPGWARDGAKRFLTRVWREFPVMARFLKACKKLADIAVKRSPYAGLNLTDPSDGALVRWNPIKIQQRRIKIDKMDAFIWQPIGRKNFEGDYPVDSRALRKKVAPCLTQLLDAYYSSLVMKHLRALGVTTFVGIHDCWLVPEGQGQLLDVAMKRAARQWYKGLGSVYAELRKYARFSANWKPFFVTASRKWRRRVNSRKLPQFRAKEVTAKVVELSSRPDGVG